MRRGVLLVIAAIVSEVGACSSSETAITSGAPDSSCGAVIQCLDAATEKSAPAPDGDVDGDTTDGEAGGDGSNAEASSDATEDAVTWFDSGGDSGKVDAAGDSGPDSSKPDAAMDAGYDAGLVPDAASQDASSDAAPPAPCYVDPGGSTYCPTSSTWSCNGPVPPQSTIGSECTFVKGNSSASTWCCPFPYQCPSCSGGDWCGGGGGPTMCGQCGLALGESMFCPSSQSPNPWSCPNGEDSWMLANCYSAGYVGNPYLVCCKDPP